MNALVTGAAGFIGFHLCKKLIETYDLVVGLDNVNDYYDRELKWARLDQLGIGFPGKTWDVPVVGDKYKNFTFWRSDLKDQEKLASIFSTQTFDVVVHLAAQAGVRHSLTHPHEYISNNVSAFLNVLECCKANRVGHLVYASSSSVYGLNGHSQLSEKKEASHPISLYAATKRSNELMAHSYSHLYHIPTTGLRFFTVYGPWGRPDMAIFLFTQSILKGEPIRVFNYGEMVRDFTYIDDIITGVTQVVAQKPEIRNDWDPIETPLWFSSAPFRIYNIGRGNPVRLMDFIRNIEEELGIKAKKELLDIQQGDVAKTLADTSLLATDLGYSPSTDINDGVRAFISWYKKYYGY